MGPAYWMLIVFAAFAVGSCDETVNTKTAQATNMKIVSKDDAVNKRQTAQEANAGLTHLQYGASPGHYVIKSVKDDDAQFNLEYLNLLKKLQGTIQTAAAEPRPAIQQYVVQRNPRPYQVRPPPPQREQKVITIDPSTENEQALYLDEKYFVQQPRAPLVLRPSQAVKNSPVQGLYSQGYVPISQGHALHDARVQAALSVGDGKPYGQAASQSIYKGPQKSQNPFADSSFEKELAELVAANQAAELKQRPHHITYFPPVAQSQPQIISGPPSPKKFSQIRINQPSYTSAPIPLARSKTPAPQQYLIETTQPQTVQSRPVPQKTKPQYLQIYSGEEPKYVEYQPTEQRSALKIVAAPKLETPQPPVEYEYVPQKQTPNSPPAYVKYYQSIKPQTEEVTAPKEVKIGSFYPKYNVPKQQASASQAPTEEQPQYVIRYQPQSKPDEPALNYVRYESSKPQVAQYSNENEAYIRAILAQSQAQIQKGSQREPARPEKPVKIQPKPQPSPVKDEAHSSIFISKTINKKPEQSVKILSSPQSEPEEEVQTVRLPPPKNNKVYTQEEFQALLAAGYSVTPIPVTDDDDTLAKFSPAPAGYPGQNDFAVKYVSSPPEEQYYGKDNSEAYAARANDSPAQPQRRRKQRRPTVPPQYRLRQDNVQGVSETQTQLKYSLPLETEETINYGTRNQPRTRNVSSS